MTHVAYEADGWGVGELWLDGARLLQHELPADPALVAGSRDAQSDLAARFRDYFRGGRDDFADVELDLDWTTPFQRAHPPALRAVPKLDVVTNGDQG